MNLDVCLGDINKNSEISKNNNNSNENKIFNKVLIEKKFPLVQKEIVSLVNSLILIIKLEDVRVLRTFLLFFNE